MPQKPEADETRLARQNREVEQLTKAHLNAVTDLRESYVGRENSADFINSLQNLHAKFAEDARVLVGRHRNESASPPPVEAKE